MFKIKIHVGVGMNSKEREEVLDLCKHISPGLMERKGDRLMLYKEYWYMNSKRTSRDKTQFTSNQVNQKWTWGGGGFLGCNPPNAHSPYLQYAVLL